MTSFQSRHFVAVPSNTSGLPSPLVSTCAHCCHGVHPPAGKESSWTYIAALAVLCLSSSPFKLLHPVRHVLQCFCCFTDLIALTGAPPPSITFFGEPLWKSSTSPVESSRRIPTTNEDGKQHLTKTSLNGLQTRTSTRRNSQVLFRLSERHKSVEQ